MIKNLWITKSTDDSFSITFESDNEQIPIIPREFTFPDADDHNNKIKRHTVKIGLLTAQDLLKIWKTVSMYMCEFAESD